MPAKLVSIPSSEIGELEGKLNQLLALPEFQGYEVAASFPNSDFSQIGLIFQNP